MASAILASLGSFLFGFDTAVISGTTDSLRTVFELTDNTLGFTVSSALLGTMVGSLIVGRPADWWGRRKMLALLAGLFLLSSVGCAGAWNWYALLFFRWLGGIAVGAASVVCPVYITEIAPARQRGALVAVSQLNIVIGVLLSYLSNYLVARFIGADNTTIWRYMFGVMIVPSALSELLPLTSPRVRAGWSSKAARLKRSTCWCAWAAPTPKPNALRLPPLSRRKCPARTSGCSSPNISSLCCSLS